VEGGDKIRIAEKEWREAKARISKTTLMGK